MSEKNNRSDDDDGLKEFLGPHLADVDDEGSSPTLRPPDGLHEDEPEEDATPTMRPPAPEPEIVVEDLEPEVHYNPESDQTSVSLNRCHSLFHQHLRRVNKVRQQFNFEITQKIDGEWLHITYKYPSPGQES